ncbi:MAG: hypothetical protein EOO11_17725 [Chitinophagaceae bacterium]|nr:MAG: hypothetical protein EOO11_17725 [Chitinophagaceae bacterium]
MSTQFLDVLVALLLCLLLLGCAALYLFCFFDVRRRDAKWHSDKDYWLDTLWQMPMVGSILYLSRRGQYWKEE